MCNRLTERRLSRHRPLPAARLTALAAFHLAASLTACGTQPGVSASVSLQSILVMSSATRSTAWGAGEHGDAFPRDIPLPTVHALAAATLHFEVRA